MANVKGGRFVDSLHYPIVNPETGEQHYPGEDGNWRFSKEKIERLLANDEIWFGESGDGRPKLKRFLCDVKDGVTYPSIWDFVALNTDGSKEMKRLLGSSTAFENPKPAGLLKELVHLCSSDGDIVLDCFAGSGTSAHGVWLADIADETQRRWLLVQIEEKVNGKSGGHRNGFHTVSEICRKRLRSTAASLHGEELDSGFRSYRLDSSNIRTWNPHPDDIEHALFDAVDNIKPDRDEQDVLVELLLKRGLDLCVPIEDREIAGLPAHSIGGGVIVTCLVETIDADAAIPLAEGIADWLDELDPATETSVVFRDSAFADDVSKTNVAAILTQRGIDEVRSL